MTTSPLQTPFILSFDIGSSSMRTILFDRLGRQVQRSSATRPVQLRSTATGASEADPAALAEALFSCFDETLDRTKKLTASIGGVASCSFVSNICGLDAAGEVVLPLTTYADTRATPEVAGLQADLAEATIYQRTGCRFHASYLPARLRWLARTYPADFQRVTRWLSLGEYVARRLFGETAVSYSVASWSGLLNRHTLTWDEDLLAHLPIQAEQLSPLTDLDQPQRGLRPEFAQRWPALRDVPWFPTLGDGAAANIGSGCATTERVALTIGTTSALRVVIEPNVPLVPEGLWCYRVDRRRSLLGGALSEGGNLLAWLRDQLQLGEAVELNNQLAALEPDSQGLTVLPFLAGERSPGWAGEAKATVHGLTLATTPLHILQAGLEAVAYRIALVFQRMQGELSEEPHLIVSGGALQHWPAWTQIIADVLGRPLLVSAVSEASGRGAALLALEALGMTKLIDLTPSIVAEFAPRLAYQERYQAAIARQQTLYHILVKP